MAGLRRPACPSTCGRQRGQALHREIRATLPGAEKPGNLLTPSPSRPISFTLLLHQQPSPRSSPVAFDRYSGACPGGSCFGRPGQLTPAQPRPYHSPTTIGAPCCSSAGRRLPHLPRRSARNYYEECQTRTSITPPHCRRRGPLHLRAPGWEKVADFALDWGPGTAPRNSLVHPTTARRKAAIYNYGPREASWIVSANTIWTPCWHRRFFWTWAAARLSWRFPLLLGRQE